MINTIQIMRCIAATVVVLAHSGWTAYGVSHQVTNLGGIGVDIFFIVSGFIMPYVVFGGLYHDKSTVVISSGSFFIKRLTRILPLYFLSTVAVLILSAFVSICLHPDVDLAYMYNPGKFSFSWFLKSLTFTHWHSPPLLAIGWTLQLEFVFYTFFAAVIAIKHIKIDLIEIIFGLFVLVSNILVNAEVTRGLVSYMPFLLVFSQPMMIEFLFGMILYRLYSSNIVLPTKLSILILIVALPVFAYLSLTDFFGYLNLMSSSVSRILLWGGTAFFIVWAALSLEKLFVLNRFTQKLLLLGDASYSLYLVHWLTIPFITFVFARYNLYTSVNMYIFLMLNFLICQKIALLVHIKIEKPMNKFIRQINFRNNLVRMLNALTPRSTKIGKEI